MEKNIKRYTVTTVLEYDKDGDVTREERCEDTEYYEPESDPKLTFTPFDGWMQYPGNPITHPYVTYCSDPSAHTTPSGSAFENIMSTYKEI